MNNLGIIGYPLKNTLSPLLHSYFLAKAGINGGYTAFELKETMELPVLMHFLERFSFIGLSVTSPHKQAIMQHVSESDNLVTTLGVANTLKMTRNGWKAYNTDVYGFDRQLDLDGVSFNGKSVLVFGAGGAARSVMLNLSKRGVKEVTVVNRTPGRVDVLAMKFPAMTVKYMHFEGLKRGLFFDIVINTAPVDWSNKMWLDHFWRGKEGLFTPETAIDLQYRPWDTAFLNLWGNSKKFNGFTMLVEQAAAAFEIWCGVRPQYNLNELRILAFK